MLAIARYEILEGNKRKGLCFVGVPCLIEALGRGNKFISETTIGRATG